MKQPGVDASGEDAQELWAARCGDAEALGRLFIRYENYLKVLAAPELGRRLRARLDASDVVQETFCEAGRDFGHFRGTSMREFLGWLRTILANNVARTIEKNVRAAKRNLRREVSVKELADAMGRSSVRLESILADRGASPSVVADRQDQKVQLVEALDRLSDDYREVLVRRHLEGEAFKQIAKEMKRGEGAVRMLWLRALDRLRKEMVEGKKENR